MSRNYNSHVKEGNVVIYQGLIWIVTHRDTCTSKLVSINDSKRYTIINNESPQARLELRADNPADYFMETIENHFSQ